MPPLLLFDFDGVIVDSLTVFHELLDAACRAQGVALAGGREGFLRLFDGNMIAGLRQAGVAADQLDPILAGLGSRLAAAADRYPPFPGIVAAFHVLTAEAPVYVITSNLTAVVRAHLERHGIRGVRDVLGSDRERSKQAKIRTVAALWPDRQPVCIGDTRGDMDEAHAAGATAVAACWGWHGEERLLLGRPERLLRRPAELVDLIRVGHEDKDLPRSV
jgi:phosphoglycolate phosphatase